MAKGKKSDKGGVKRRAPASSDVQQTPTKRKTRSTSDGKTVGFNPAPIPGLSPKSPKGTPGTKPDTPNAKPGNTVAWEWPIPDTPQARARAKDLRFGGKKVTANLIKLCNSTDGYEKFLTGVPVPKNKDIITKILQEEFGIGPDSEQESDMSDVEMD